MVLRKDALSWMHWLLCTLPWEGEIQTFLSIMKHWFCVTSHWKLSWLSPSKAVRNATWNCSTCLIMWKFTGEVQYLSFLHNQNLVIDEISKGLLLQHHLLICFVSTKKGKFSAVFSKIYRGRCCSVLQNIYTWGWFIGSVQSPVTRLWPGAELSGSTLGCLHLLSQVNAYVEWMLHPSLWFICLGPWQSCLAHLVHK